MSASDETVIEPAPDDETLDENVWQTIKEWPCADVAGLLAYVRARWADTDDGYWQEEDATDDLLHRPVRRYLVSTAGWSDNEWLVGAMEENWMFWARCWVQSRRGGHYIFEHPREVQQ